MFQIAFTRRIWLVTGNCSPVFSFTATKCPMPCSSGGLPVAMVVHRIGLSIGSLLPELGKVRHLALGHEQIDDPRIDAIEAEHDDASRRGLRAAAEAEGSE